MVPRARLNNINHARSERGYARGGYTRLPHWPLRCPPVSNATINYPTVAATALARLSVSFSFSHGATFFLRSHAHPASRSLSFVSCRSFSLFLSLLQPLHLAAPRREISADSPRLLRSRLTRENPSQGRGRVFFGLLTRGSQRSCLGYFCTALGLPAAALTYHYRRGGMTLRDIALALRVRCASCVGQVLIRAFLRIVLHAHVDSRIS